MGTIVLTYKLRNNIDTHISHHVSWLPSSTSRALRQHPGSSEGGYIRSTEHDAARTDADQERPLLCSSTPIHRAALAREPTTDGLRYVKESARCSRAAQTDDGETDSGPHVTSTLSAVLYPAAGFSDWQAGLYRV